MRQARSTPTDLSTLRLLAARYFAGLLWVHVPVVAVVAAMNGSDAEALTAAMAVAAAIGTAAALAWGGNLQGRCTLAAMLTVAPMLLVYATSGTWQIDWHTYFFVIFGMLVAFVDWRPIAVSAGLAAAHNIVLGLVFPADVFPEATLGRAALHGAIIVADFVVLLWIVQRMKRLYSHSRSSLEFGARALERAQLLESVVVNANDAVLISDANLRSDGSIDSAGHRIVYVNDAFSRITGYDGEAVVGRTVDALAGAYSGDLASCFLPRDVGESGKCNGVWQSLDGRRIDVEASMVGVDGALSGALRTVTVLRDVTESRRAGEAELRAKLAEEVNAALRREVDERRVAEERLAFAAYHDDLTGLPNRAYFRVRLAAALASAEDAWQPAAVLFLDLDRFKLVNDGLGHLVGDRLLVQVAARLQQTLREADTLARLGGDEFIVLVERPSGVTELESVAKRLLASFAAPFEINGREMYTTASIGIAYGRRGAGDEADDVLRNADLALYRAKSQGKGRYELFSPELLERSTRLLQLETELRRALERSALSVFFQPIVALDDERLCGFEALVRWRHPEAGFIVPTEFIPVAEDTGLIIDVGRFVLKFSCEQLRLWLDTFPRYPNLWVSVNVSPVQLREERFGKFVAETLAEHRIPPELLHLEITESTLVRDLVSIGPVLGELRKLGIRISIDDFGTGFSSLEYLDKLPVDLLKIDRSFVSGRGDGIANLKIVRTIVNLAKDLELGVIAEGIETSGQAETLRVLNHRAYGQGYHYHKPLDAHAAFETIDAQHRRLRHEASDYGSRLGA